MPSLYAQDVSHVKKRIEMHRTIGDCTSACLELHEWLEKNPSDNSLLRLELETLAWCGKTSQLLRAYKAYREKAEDAFDPKLLETICWTVLEEGRHSTNSLIRQHSLVSAFYTQDARLVPFCLDALTDTSHQVRLLMLKLAGNVRDDLVQRKVYEIFQQSTSPLERLLAMQALCTAECIPMQEVLGGVLDTGSSLLDEKVVAIEALSHSLSECTDEHLCSYLSSNRAYLRAVCCHVILQKQKHHLLDRVKPLVFDASEEVRQHALQCIGLLVKKEDAFLTSDEFFSLLEHSDKKTVAMTCWALLQHGKKALVEKHFQTLLTSSDKNIALLSAGLLAHSQQEGLELLSWGMRQALDPLVRLNLAIGLIYLQNDLQAAQTCILEALETTSDRLSWHEEGIFSFVGPSTYCHVVQKVALPETIDLLTRLDLYKMLALKSDIDLVKHLKPHLTARSWGVTLEASAFIMQEHTERFECLAALLDDKNPEVSLQAAFILAHFTQNEKALDVLQKQYPKVSRELKEYILIAIGQIGAKNSLPFLTSVLDESFESLRISACRSILLCINA